ncbi:MAG TPA: error-prone DNA polymerase [Gammaproteobacteria bacterium]|nr:error-prone DNA polymerase [Gammaproteobacteria bacterium]
MDYAELNCLSNFTFLRGASHPEELVAQAARLGYRALALTDECSLSGVVRAHEAAKAHGIKLIIGSELRLTDGLKLVALATNREGYAQLSALITTGRRRADKGDYRLERGDFDSGLPDCLCLLLGQYQADELTPPPEEATRWARALFPDRCWLAVTRLHLPGEQARIETLRALGEAHRIPLVACGDVHMHRRGRRALQDLLTAIRLKTTVARAGRALHPNGERHLRPLATLAELYEPAWLAETLRIADRCQFSLDELRYEYPDDLVPPGLMADEYLRQLTEAGIRHYWPEGEPAKVRRQIEHELAVIAELGYAHFFLTVHDLVRFARSRGILCQGRGSAANSAVCYCLHITAVDPARANMLFERFISRERNEPPDIDMDFEHSLREEVMQYIYRKYGRHRAALAASVITYRRRGALRDAGRALGLNADQLGRLTRNLVWWEKDIPEDRLREAGFDPGNPVIRRLLALARELIGFPRHLSQHVGGFVIARDELSRLVPVENAAMADRTVIQWDKHDLESLGLLKVDCLALGMLSAIRRCFDLLRRHGGPDLNLDNIPPGDPATFAMIQRADTVGVFQIESRAQMNMLPRLKPKTFYDLVIQIAIVRPGPIQGEMVHPYLRRRRGEEPVTYPSEAVRAVLERTLGVPIFQEQVIELAMAAAGFSGGEADQLRRAIAAWRSSRQLESFRQKLIDGMRQRGYDQRFAEQIFNQIKGFGEYGFPESHSASFALLAYVSAWLKRHHPAAFTCALLNSQPMGFYAPAQLVQDARRHRVTVRPVDVRHSDWESTLEPDDKGPALRLGLHLVKGLSEKTGRKIAALRREEAFRDLHDLHRRARLDRKESRALAAADAFRGLAGNRHQAVWQSLGAEIQPGLFEDLPPPDSADVRLPEPGEAEDIVADYAHTGLTLRRHPLALLRPRFNRRGWLSSKTLWRCANHRRARIAGLVINRQHPNAGGTVFLTLEDEFGSINIIVWQRIVQTHLQAVVHGRLLMVEGKLEREGLVQHLIADRIEDHSAWLGRLETQSRDFH